MPLVQPKHRRGPNAGKPKQLNEDQRRAKALRDALVVESWRHLLQGLWWSGLRLGEALAMHWIDDRFLCPDFTGKRPMFRIRAAGEKWHKDRVLPMAPEFAEFVAATPKDRQDGFVFNPEPLRAGSPRISLDRVSKVICDIGEAAGVKASDRGNARRRAKEGEDASPSRNWASAHDLRRAFGFRWAMRVRAPILQQLMRHESITTTLEFYVGQDAEAAADILWEAVATTGAIAELRSAGAL